MKVALRQVRGPWAQGWVLDKHIEYSRFLGHDESGRKQFDTLRTEVGEATYQLKYRGQWDRVPVLAQAIAESICPKLADIGFIVPMPPSKHRARQPVIEIARALGERIKLPVFENLLLKQPTGTAVKDLGTRDEKLAALANALKVHDEIASQGQWNALLVDDLFDSGASMEAAAKVLGAYAKVRNVYVAALTWAE